LTPPEDSHKQETVKAICTLAELAPQLAQEGEQFVSTDELTGVQALERQHPGRPLAPGKVERREFESIRPGTRSFLVSREVLRGKILAPACGPTRTEADFLAHLQAVVATDPEARRWHARL
jgi:putative transposase